MKILSGRWLAAICCVWTMAAYADIILESPPEVPTTLNANEFKPFIATRNDLLTQCDATRAQIAAQAQNCRDVAEDSPKVSTCLVQAQAVRVAVRNYRGALAQFKADLATAGALQQSETTLAGKLSMSARHHLQPIDIKSHGDFHVMMSDGRILSGKAATHLSGDAAVRLVTGADGGAVLKLSDHTQVTLGPNTELKTKVPDRSSGTTQGFLFELTQGTLHWYHEVKKQLGASYVQSSYEDYNKIDTEAVVVGVRGTTFDCAVLPHGSGYIKLYSGAVDLTPKDGGKVVQLHPGQMVNMRGRKMSGPVAIP